MIDVDMFTDEQKRFLSALVSDFGGPTSTGNVLRVLEATLHEVKPEWERDPSLVENQDLRSDLEVCLAALHYMKVKYAAEAG